MFQMGNIMMGKVRYNPKHNAHLTKAADQVLAMFNVMGASVASPKAQYPALPNTTIKSEITVRVAIKR